MPIVTMPKPLYLPAHMAIAVQSAMIAANFEGEDFHIDFGRIDVFKAEDGRIVVRGGFHRYEEHADEGAFRAAYGLDDWQPKLLAVAYELEAMCEAMLIAPEDEGKDFSASIWWKRQERCRAAIALAFANSR
ncbi:MAG: hypothetical protein DI563_05485 [Variovorax paradoxus]|uniref:Uncharacterized protein n=1 Tax=Variovorax paradoxus TaxID=34073 RepID=A0A2W5QIR9_VARPD|nr:MAG: hypothetical protein DI563_05485 [Variovorax paradoxus]